MTDKEIINMHAKCGGGPVTKESILSEHQKMGGRILNWEELKNQHTKYGTLPVEIHTVRLEGTLEEGLDGLKKGSIEWLKLVGYQENIVCPYCERINKYYDKTSEERHTLVFEEGNKEINCPYCGNRYEILCHIDVKFLTIKRGKIKDEDNT